jgi:hypothetical protein
MAHRRTWALIGVLSVVAALLVSLSTTPAYAASGCSGAGHWFAGYTSDLHIDYGTQAQIVTQQTSLCTGSTASTDATEWVMLNSNDYNQYVQTGYYRDRTTSVPYFWAESYIVGQPYQFYVDYNDPAPAIGSTHTYTVQYNASMGAEISGFDYTALIQTSVPFGTGVWSTRGHQYLGEIHDAGTDIYGNASNPVNFYYLAVQQPYHTCCQVVTQNLSPARDLSKFSVSPVGYAAFSTHD